jgi:hypothetical protein
VTADASGLYGFCEAWWVSVRTILTERRSVGEVVLVP